MRKNGSSDREKLLKFEAEGGEFSKILQILGLQPRISKVFYLKSFSRSLEQLFLTVGQNNYGNKVPFIAKTCNFARFSLLQFIPINLFTSRLKYACNLACLPRFCDAF